MAPVEIRPIYGQSPSPAPLAPPVALVAGGVPSGVNPPVRGTINFEANVDGPWFRSRQDIARKMKVLVEVAEEAWAIGDQRGTPPNAAETYVLGVFAAANWAVGILTEAPMSHRARPVSNQNIKAELAIAREMAQSTDQNRVVYALGVLVWFTWLDGVTDTIQYPAASEF